MVNYSVTNVIKWLFILTQVTFTLIFIWDAVDNWQTYPSVTSIDVANIDQELFPAVTVCYPNTWKWPGILKLLSNWVKSNKTMENTLFGINSKEVRLGDGNDIHERFLELARKKLSAVDQSQFRDTCTLVNRTFNSPKGQKQGQFLFNMYGQVILNYGFVSDEFYKIIDMWNRWQDGESLAFDDIKSDICQLEYLDCQNDDNECLNYMQTIGYLDFSVSKSLYALWAFSTFWEPRTLLQMYLYKGMP